MAQALDPLSLLHQLEQMQQAVRCCAGTTLPLLQGVSATCIQPFCLQRCLPGALPSEEKGVVSTAAPPMRQHEQQRDMGVLDWRRTSRDPFEGQWERIVSLVLTHPEWSGGDLFQEMQPLFPERYRPSQQRTLQIGLRKIRARLLDIMQEPWPLELIHSPVVKTEPDQREPEGERKRRVPRVASPFLLVGCPQGQQRATASPPSPESIIEEEIRSPEGSAPSAVPSHGEQSNAEPDPVRYPLDVPLPQPCVQRGSVQTQLATLTIEWAIQSYLQEQRASGRSPKTLEWHQTALGLFQQYLVDERHLHLLCQITEAEVRSWVAFLGTTPSTKDTTRSAGTVATYARSARAFCHWAVRNGHLDSLPIVGGTMPKAGRKPIHVIEPDEFERLRLSCRAAGESEVSGARAAARNCAILWVFMDTGMRVSELCALRLSDVDRERRTLRVQETGGSERWLGLSSNGWDQALFYLERYRPKKVRREDGDVHDDHLFLSEWYQPLTSNSLTLLFDRLCKRAGISDKPVSPSVLRDTFAVRFLQSGGELDALGSVLSLRDTASLKRYERLSAQKIENEQQKEPGEEHLSRPMAAPQQSRRRRRNSSSTATSSHQQRQAGRLNGTVEKEPITDAEEDP